MVTARRIVGQDTGNHISHGLMSEATSWVFSAVRSGNAKPPESLHTPKQARVLSEYAGTGSVHRNSG